MSISYDYAGPFKSYSEAEAELEDLYATGAVSECERPDIERRRGRFVITLLVAV
jgi:hypothetical protein